MKIKLSIITILAGLGGSLSAATLVDDFSGGLGSWTNTVILDNGGAASNTSAFVVNGGTGELELITTSYDNIEQYAYIRTGATLDVGEEAQLALSIPLSGNRNLGLYVGGTAPVTHAGGGAPTRFDYITNYAADTGAVATRGHDGSSEYTNTQVFPAAADTLFIARTATNTFEVGYYNGATRTVYETRNPSFANTADFVGIYGDVREVGTVGAISEFRIVPEPSSALLLGLGCVGFAVRRRRA